jgi:uncharacterized protein (TIGR02217 family)
LIDYKATGQLLGTGDGVQTQLQLVKSYPSGSVVEVRTISKPVTGTVRIYKDGIEQLSGWMANIPTGLITFNTPPALGVEVTADFEFDVPVRFDTDHIAVTIEPTGCTPGSRSRSSRRDRDGRQGQRVALVSEGYSSL